jgi:hypothetical protein
MLLFFFVVLGTAQSFAVQWNQELAAQCVAVGGHCTQPLPVTSLLSLLGSTIVLGFIAIGVPFTAAAIVSHGTSMALEHLAAAKYLSAGGMRSMSRAIGGMSRQISRLVRSSSQKATLEKRMAAGAQAATQVAANRPITSPQRNAHGVQRTQALPKNNGAKPTSLI